MWVNVIYIRDGLVKSFQVSANLVNHYFFNLINGTGRSCTIVQISDAGACRSNALYSFLLGGLNFWFQHSRFLVCRKFLGRCHFKGQDVLALGKVHKENPCSDSFLKDLCRKSVWIRTTGKHFDCYVCSFLEFPPSCLCFLFPSPCLFSCSFSHCFPLSLPSYCHCHIVHCECASLLPCVVTGHIVHLQRGERNVSLIHPSFWF